ncbi:hypothetical protein NLA06_08015 [Desulfomicrobium sp. ZS1]|uniref:hypothetical protein n=1 Tax=Desulfomicrobium sp. ZS1 TaxID=2952228 RepID=UPI0020B20E1F|nr:hypothetical protein [Desulfomicrobium sp. ZS1]UTF51819.1 hypothetical protein NLA06_08015 [Desulfomicrobium sp. ZS1]
MNNRTFPLLAALSSTDIVEDNELEKNLNGLRKSIEDELLPRLYESRYIEKSRLELGLDSVLKDAATLCRRPELLGRTCVGIVCADDTALPVIDALGHDRDSLAAFDCDSRFHHAWTMRTSIPLWLVHDADNPRVTVADLMGRDVALNGIIGDRENKRIALLPEEYETLLALGEDGIDPRDVVSALSYFVPLKRPQSVYFILPPQEFERDGYEKYIAQCDVVFVCGTVHNEYCINALCDNFNMPVYFVAKDAAAVRDTVKIIKDKVPERIVDVVNIKDVDCLLDSYNGYVDRITIYDRLMYEMLAFIESVSIKIAQHRNLTDDIKRDYILSLKTQSNINDILEKIQNDFLQNNTMLEKNKDDFSAAYHRVLADAADLEALLRNIGPARPSNEANGRLHAGPMSHSSLWRRIILRALASDNPALAEKYQNKFAKLYPEQAFVTELYINKNKQIPISPSSIEQLRHMPDNPEVFRAKIFFREELGLSEQDCAEIAALLPKHKNADEKYFWAVHLNEVYQQHKKNGTRAPLPFTDVLTAFRRAVLAGSDAAAQTFAIYCGGENLFDEAREIADMAQPTAAFVYRLLCLTRGDSTTAHRYLKMSAALEYPAAVSSFAEECWENRACGAAISFDYGEGVLRGIDSEAINSGVAIYEYLQSNKLQGLNVPDISERLGFFYFCSEQWRKSRAALDNAPRTPEGKFSLAVMLKYGHGGNLSKEEAIRLMIEAESMDGFFARVATAIKNKWHVDDRARI